jgi:hypothetical protein
MMLKGGILNNLIAPYTELPGYSSLTQEPIAQSRCNRLQVSRQQTPRSYKIAGTPLSNTIGHIQAHELKIVVSKICQEGYGRLRLRTFIRFCVTSMESGVFVSPIRYFHPFTDELLSVVVLAKLTAGVFSASFGISLSKI